MKMHIVDGNGFLEDVRDLIQEYLIELKRDLSFQNITEELNDLSYKYSAPNGELLAIKDCDRIFGIVAFKRHSDVRCEMKRLYVHPSYRGHHFGDVLVTEIIEHAKKAGFKEMVLDTIEPLKVAISLYKKHGFEVCDAYYDNPMDDVIFMCKKL